MNQIITPDEYYKATVKLAKIIKKEFKTDIIVPIMNGGLLPCAILTEELNIKDVRPINVFRKGNKREIVYDIQGNIKNKKIILLDDLIPENHGLGFKIVKKILENRGAIVKTASPFIGKNSNVDFFVEIVNLEIDLFWKPQRIGDRF